MENGEHLIASGVTLLDNYSVADNLKYGNFMQASHVFLYALTDQWALEEFPRKAIVLMQMRFDGCIGFPGGLVDEGEDPADAATREMVEEIAYDPKAFGRISEKDRIFTHVDEKKKLLLNFYAKKLTEAEIQTIIVNSPSASDFGNESLGLIIVPLYTMEDTLRGLPGFLRNNFIGNAKLQLTSALVLLKILTKEEVDRALS